MDDTPLYNSRLIKNYIEYVTEKYPHIPIHDVLDHAGISDYELEDQGHWLTQRQVNRFHEALSQESVGPEIYREVGRFSISSKAIGLIRQYAVGLMTPIAAYSLMEKFVTQLNRSLTIATKKIDGNKVEITFRLKPGVTERPYICENRIGMMESLAQLYTKRYPLIEHPVCIHKGGDHCLYNISWEITPPMRWKQFRNYAVVLTLPLLIASYLFLPHYWWEAFLILCLSGNFGIFYHAANLEKKDMIEMLENQGDAASLLVNQINTRYNEMLLIQEIGQATSKILDTDQLLKFIVEALEKRLDFGRGMIMLTNKDKTEIVYTVGYGYNPEHEAVLKETAFHVDKAESRGAAVVSFRQQIPVLVNDIGEIKDQISKRSLEFARVLGVESFISVPIVYEKESLGVLMVDNPRSKRSLSQSDINLLMGIAPQIAISLKNAIAYGMIREREERFRSLSENSPDIIYTLGLDGAFTYINPAWEKIMGYAVQDVIGRYFIDFVRKEDVSQYTRQFKRVRDERRIIQDEIGVMVHRDGTDRHFIIGGAPNLDAEGNVIGIVGTFKDISDLKRSEEELRQSYEKLRATLDVTIQAISMIVEARDPYTSGHQERVARLSCAIAEEMGLSNEQVTSIRMAALLHDVGKINVPAEILSKPTRLNDIEFGMIRTHPQVGYNILKTIDFPFPVDKIVLQHHERINGSGYPTGLLGEDIILEARILAVSDVVESMASHRPYRPAQTIEATLDEIQQYKGVFYDSGVVDACLKIFHEKGFRL